MHRLNFRHWTYICVAAVIVMAILAVALHPEIRLLSPLLLPPLLASVTTTPRRTALVIALSLAATVGIAAGVYEEPFSSDILLRASVTVIGSGLALWTSILRERDQRTRRRIALIENARGELDAARGMEDDLVSFARAAVKGFALWAFVDVRVPDAEAERITVADADSPASERMAPRKGATAAAAAFAERAQREGPRLVHDAEAELLQCLFEDFSARRGEGFEVMILPVSIGEVTATYFLVCPEPHPPWGEAELAQTASLARAAALAARNDQLIDQLTYAQGELRRSRDQVEAIIGGIADGVAAQSATGEMIYVNDAAAEMFGFESAEQLIGSDYTDVASRMELRDEDGEPFDPQNLPSRRAMRGEERPEAHLRYVVRSTGREWWVSVKARAIHDEDGEPQMAISVIEDQTERRRGELAVRFLSDVSKELYASSDPVATAARLATACVPVIADRCAVDLALGAAELARVADQDGPVDAKSTGIAQQVLVSGVPEHFAAGTDSKRSAAAFGAPETEAPRETLVAPLTARGKPVGTISLAIDRPGMRFTDYDVETALELGRRAGLALEAAFDARNREKSLDTLQKSLLPRRLPEFPGIELAARFRPSQIDLDVSGDFYDAFAMGDGSIALVIGDVCGKGPEAAAVTALARYTLRAEALRQSNPAELLRTLNEAMLDQVSEDRFCTVAVARFSRRGSGERHLDVVSAGHPLPILIRGAENEPVGEPGTLLGVVERPELTTRTVELADGDALVLYTDGIAAGLTTDDVGYARELLAGVRSRDADELARAFEDAAIAGASAPNRDDIAILAACFE